MAWFVEKAAFDALHDSEGEYEELEDDFLFIANEGQVALVLAEEEKGGADGKNKDEDPEEVDLEADYKNRANVQILEAKDYEDDEERALREYRERMAALLPAAGANFTGVFAAQNELDKGFDAFMDEEYDDAQIGGLDGEEIEAAERVQQKVLDEAVDEFIVDKKQRFPDHYKEFGTVTEEAGKLMRGQNVGVPHQEELEEEADREKAAAELKQKQLESEARFQQAAEERGSDISEEESDGEAKWDCDTILTTYTNTDNHPGVIKTERRIKPSERNKIMLHKQFKVPVDGLIPVAEEITIQKEKRKADLSGPFQRQEVDDDEQEKREEIEEDKDGAPLDPRKAHKKQVKEEQRDKRKLKKELKQAFETEKHRNHKVNTVDAGMIKPGVSVKKIY